MSIKFELFTGILCPNEDGTHDLEIYYKMSGKHYATLTRTPGRSFSEHCFSLFKAEELMAEAVVMAGEADRQVENSV